MLGLSSLENWPPCERTSTQRLLTSLLPSPEMLKTQPLNMCVEATLDGVASKKAVGKCFEHLTDSVTQASPLITGISYTSKISCRPSSSASWPAKQCVTSSDMYRLIVAPPLLRNSSV